jgi:SAM-dependent methyltransferase
LRCPVSRGPLDLHVIDREEVDGREHVRTGVLTCATSGLWYPIINYVPVMLTFRTALADRFARDHAGLASLHGYKAPDLPAMPGERSVQKTFTEEWEGLGADELTFLYTDTELVELHRDVWLHLPPQGAPHVRSVLNVGCGFGREAEILSGLFPEAEVIGLDLNLSLLRAAPDLLNRTRLHLVIASLFRPPFAVGTFDHVHSQGVIHHTYSTHEAFKAIEPLVKPDGTIFIWVYAAEDSLVVPGMRGVMVRAYWIISHQLGRPILSRLPAPLRNGAVWLLSAILHPLLRSRARQGEKWKFANTLHGLRDAFTPRYAHQHGFNEVLEWFEDSGYAIAIQSPSRFRALTQGKRMLGIGLLGWRGSRERPWT